MSLEKTKQKEKSSTQCIVVINWGIMEYADTDNRTKGKIKIKLLSIFYILSLYYHFSVAKEIKIKMSQITNLIRFS